MKAVKVSALINNYIAQPYWPELERAVTIEKNSGANRQKSDDKRHAAISAYCELHGMTYDDYLRSKRPLRSVGTPTSRGTSSSPGIISRGCLCRR